MAGVEKVGWWADGGREHLEDWLAEEAKVQPGRGVVQLEDDQLVGPGLEPRGLRKTHDLR